MQVPDCMPKTAARLPACDEDYGADNGRHFATAGPPPSPYSATVRPRRHAAALNRPYRRYSVGTTNMLSSVDVVNPQRMTIAIGV